MTMAGTQRWSLMLRAPVCLAAAVVVTLSATACGDVREGRGEAAGIAGTEGAPGAAIGWSGVFLPTHLSYAEPPNDSIDDYDWTKVVAVVGPIVGVEWRSPEFADPAAVAAGEATPEEQAAGRITALVDVQEVLQGTLPSGTGPTVRVPLPGRLAVSLEEAQTRVTSVGPILWILVDDIPGSAHVAADGVFIQGGTFVFQYGRVESPFRPGLADSMMNGTGSTTLDDLVAAFRAG